MNTNRFILPLILIILIICSCEYKKDDFVGVYINNYSENINTKVIPSEAPKKKDTLILFKDNTFISSCLGKGTYRIYERNNLDKIELLYEDNRLKIGYELTVKKTQFLIKIFY